ncbi:MAG: MFS transporter [Nitrososphaerales archaeon]
MIASPRSRLEFTSILVLALGWTMIYADRLSISPLLVVIKNEFGLSFFSTSLVISVYFLTYVAFTIPITIAAMKYGFKKVMVLFFLLAAVSLGIAGIVGYSFFLLVFLIGLHGVGAGGYYPTAYTISTEMVPKEKIGFASAIINSGMAFGSMLGLVIAGPILSIFPNNWQVVLIILSIPTFFVAALLHKFVPATQIVARPNIFSQYSRALKSKNFLMLSGAMFCSLYGYWVILSWGPGFLQERGQTVLASGATTAVFAAVAVIPSILIGRHTDKIGRKKTALLILPVAALSIFFMAYSSSLFGFLLAIVAYGIAGKLTLDPIVIAWVADLTPRDILGPTLAILNVAAMSSSILAPTITGALADATGSLANGFYFGALVVIIGTIFVVFAGTKPS